MVAEVESKTWEDNLLALAVENGAAPYWHSGPLSVESSGLHEAYRVCDTVVASHSHTFHLATGLLPGNKRRAARALYAFCRTTDDLVDRAPDDAMPSLAAWRCAAFAKDSSNPIVAAWADTRRRYRIPTCYAEQLIDGVGRDLAKTRYRTFAELTTYAYGVASTVGLMLMHIIGFSGLEAVPYAIKLGIALQLTNILRDVGEDWRAGRLYLPTEELTSFGITDVDLALGHVDERWQTFMAFQIARNRQLYAEAWPGIAMLDLDGRFAVAAAGDLYRAILGDIEAHDCDVFSRRAHVSAAEKLRRLPGIWWQCQRMGNGRGPV